MRRVPQLAAYIIKFEQKLRCLINWTDATDDARGAWLQQVRARQLPHVGPQPGLLLRRYRLVQSRPGRLESNLSRSPGLFGFGSDLEDLHLISTSAASVHLASRSVNTSQVQQASEAADLAGPVLEVERRLRGCALSAQWRQPVCATDGTMQVSAAAPAPRQWGRPPHTPNQSGEARPPL